MTILSELLDLEVVDRSMGTASVTYRTVVDPAFTIGPKVHGGSLQMVVTAAARRALGDLAATDADPGMIDGVTALAVSSDYLAAPDPAEIEIEVTVVKRGRTVSIARVDVTQGARTMVSSTVTLGRPDTGNPHYRTAHLLDGLPAEPTDDGYGIDGTPLGEINHLGAAIDLTLDPASFPAARGDSGEPVVRGWVRPKEAEAQPATMNWDFPVLVCDISPPVVMNLGMFGWAPTVQLTTYLRRVPAPGWLRFAASAVEVGQGMFAEDHLVTDSAGAVVAQSRQLALIPVRR